jgi:predicted nuclease of predicted toxin-antitoxin system
LDACIGRVAVEQLRSEGIDVAWVGADDPSASDERVLARAHAENRVLVTLDKDFGELAVVRGLPHCGIVRLVGFSAKQQASETVRALQAHAEALRDRGLVTTSPAGPRVRRPEAGS